MRRSPAPPRLARILRALPLALLAGACAMVPPAGAPEPLRVLVYNIHAGKDAGGEHNLARVAEAVRRTGADLVLLQEVDRGTERSGREDQLATLREATGMHGAFGRTLDYQGGEYGIAVLSRWPIEADTLHPLRVTPPQERAGGSYEPRGALVARVRAPAGTIHLLNTHLDASREDHYRLQEVRQVRALLDSLRAEGGLTLAGGDFNATPESPVIAEMTSAWRDAWAGCGSGDGFTYPTSAPVKRIDYLFIPRDAACASAAVLDDAASDHRGVLFVISNPATGP